MGWQDRPYYRDRNSSGTGAWMWLLNGSVPLFTVFGIRVRMHVWMILYISTNLLFSGGKGEMGPANTATAMAMLFVCVLLHEFGHCFGARWMGGTADEILLWPLGGLAMTSPPHRPWPSFVTTAAGPAVNLILCIISGTVLFLIDDAGRPIPWFPFHHGFTTYLPYNTSNLYFYTFWFFTVNYALMMFNLCLVFYPFDSGRMIQEVLWWKIGYYRSMMIATIIGMVGAVVLCALGLIYWNWLLFSIGLFGFYYSYRQRQSLREIGPEEYADQTDYSAAYEPQTPKRHRRQRSQRAIKKARKVAMEARMEQERIDQILAKVSAQGMASLTWSERRALRKATEDRRKRDLELSR